MRDSDLKSCPVCSQKQLVIVKENIDNDTFTIDCKLCGKYIISGTLLTSLSRKDNFNKNLLSSIIRNRFDQGLKTVIYTSNIDTLSEFIYIPKNPLEHINHLVNIIARHTKRPGEVFYIDPKYDYPLLFSENNSEALFYLNSAKDLGLVAPPRTFDDGYSLTIDGWVHYGNSIKDTNTRKAFVAMWFNEKVEEAWEKGFKQALIECNYQPLRIDKEEHNEKICDRIIAEINNCGLLVADFTGQRGGVYFEAGYAMGLGIPVIWTCHQEEVDKLHFDTRQYNHITWSDDQELKTKLINRINATINP